MLAKFDSDKVKKALLDGGYVAQEDLTAAEEYARTHNASFLDYFLDQGILNKDSVGQAIAESFGVMYADLNSNQPSKEQVLELPEEYAKEFRAIIFKKDEMGVMIATDEPDHPGLLEAIHLAFAGPVTVAYALSEDIDAMLLYYIKPLETRFSKIIESSEHVAPELLDEIFADALSLRVSDIHFEPRAQDVVVRFRVDGVLHEAGRLPKHSYENVLNRLKVLAHERIDEHSSAQDGSLRFEHNGHAVDMRSSIVPTVDGEKVVLRVLMSYVQGFGLVDLGLTAEHQRILDRAAEKPFGMIIVTGPTGSGKTTTLYSLIKKINVPGVNITTIEDPVEYKIEGVNQIQANAVTHLTFAEGLRSIVRQDPDIILVGEIRDLETAEMAVNASLTGHLLFSTFHANDAATAIPRLLEMKIEPFLLSSTLIVVVAQRLVRRICDQCRQSRSISRDILHQRFPGMKRYFKDENITLFEGKGCSACNGTGFKGRTGIFEFIEMTPQLQELILTNPSSQQIWKVAQTQGSRPLFDDGFAKVITGITTIDELLRVAEVPSEEASV